MTNSTNTFKYENILDEFDGPGGPYVLFNFAGEVRADALKKYPGAVQILLDIGPAVTTRSSM